MERFQVVHIPLTATSTSGVVRKTVELYKNTKRCKEVYVVGDVRNNYGEIFLTVKDGVQNYINNVSLGFFIGSLNIGNEVNIKHQLFIESAGKRLEIELHHSGIQKNTVVSVVFVLDDTDTVPSNVFGYFQKRVIIPAGTAGEFKTPLFNIPSDYKRIIGVRVEEYQKMVKTGVTYVPVDENAHDIALLTESNLIALDYVPQKMLQPQNSERQISRRFFELNIPVTDAMELRIKNVNNTSYGFDLYFEVTFLLLK